LAGPRAAAKTDNTVHLTAVTRQLLARHGLLTRETVAVEAVTGGFSAIYPVLRAMEDRGHARRGYFVAGLGAAQFGLPGAVDLLRSLRVTGRMDGAPDVALLAATDPANPFGATLRFPGTEAGTPMRIAGASVVLVDGAIAAFLQRGDRALLTWIPEQEPDRSRVARAVAYALIERARSAVPPLDERPDDREPPPRGMLVEEIDGVPAVSHALAPCFIEAGFSPGALGLRATFPR
jgi:ATP-dependent Lhr-like helicase